MSLVVSSVLPLLLIPFEHILETRMCVGYVRLFFLRCTHPLSGEAWGIPYDGDRDARHLD